MRAFHWSNARLLFVLALACGGEPEPAAPARGAEDFDQQRPVARPAEPLAQTDGEGEPTPLIEELGWTTPPTTPPRGAQESLAAALEARTEGDLDAASDALDRWIAEAPSLREARFERARIASLRGELDAAARDLEALFLADLPTYGPRYDESEDFAAIRASATGRSLAQRREAIEASYEQAAARGVSVQWRQERPGPEGRRAGAQAGVWLDGRYVPMAPTVWGAAAREDRTSFANAYLDPPRMLTAAITGARARGTQALYDLTVHAFASPSGRLIGRATIPPFDDRPVTSARARFTPGGLRWESEGRRGRLGPPGPLEGPTVEADAILVPRPQLDHVVLEDDARVRLGSGDDDPIVALPAAHRRGDASERLSDLLSLGEQHLLVVTVAEGQRTRYAVTRVDRSAAHAELLAEGEAARVRWRQGPSSALVQVDTRLLEVAAEGPPRPLPAGLAL